MSLLKSLTFCTASTDEKNPVLTRRLKLITRLEAQKRLATDPSYVVKIKRKQTNENGDRRVVESTRTIRPWWKRNASGQLIFTVRHGFKPIEFEKGKAGIVIENQEKLVSVIETIIQATGSGELDQYLSRVNIEKVRQKTESLKRL